MLFRRKPQQLERAREQAPVIDPDAAPVEPERIDGRHRGGNELDLGNRAGLADDVDIALHELAVATLLGSFGTPDGSNLDGSEHRRQLAAVAGVKPGQRNREVEPQPQVCEVERLFRGP